MPRDTLTRERIVTAAAELLDAEGLEGFNMRELGDRLGSAATAVYWHVGSKANLVALAADHVWNEIPLPDLDEVDWRTAAAAMATDLHTMLIRHPWLVQAFGAYVVYGPGKARHDDHALAIYEAAGFAGPQVDQAVAAVFTFVLGNAIGPAAQTSLMRRLASSNRNPDDAMRDTMAQAVEIAKQFPRLRERTSAPGAQYAVAPTDTFEFGLDAILDGLGAKLRSYRKPPGRS